MANISAFCDILLAQENTFEYGAGIKMRKTDQGCMQRGPSRVWPQRSCPEQMDSRESRKRKWAVHRKARVGELGGGEVCEWLSQGLSTNMWEQDGNYLEQKKSWEGLHKFTTIPAFAHTHECEFYLHSLQDNSRVQP